MSAYLIPAAARSAVEAILGPLVATQVRNGVTYYVVEWVNAPDGTDAAVTAAGGTVYPNGAAMLAALPPEPTEQTALVATARLVVAEKLDTLTEADAVELAPLFDPWQPGETVAVGDIRSYDGTLVVCVQAHTTQADWTPDVVPALWIVKRDAATPAEWVQPTGAQDAYQTGDRVLFNGNVWESVIANNVWSPAVYPAGWRQV